MSEVSPEIVIHDEPYNTASASVFTRGVAKIWDAIAAPMAEHIYTPLEDTNHALGVAAVNATLTAPRLAEIPMAKSYVENIKSHKFGKAARIIAGKMALKMTDGLDGSVSRASGTSTEFGAGFDPFVDIAGSASDVWATKQLAKNEADTTVDKLMTAGLIVDGAAVVAGGMANVLAAKYIERQGLELSKEEEPKALALAKLKYALQGAGNSLLELSYAAENHPRLKRGLRSSGVGFKAVSLVPGVISVGQYVGSAISKVKRAKSAK